MSAMDKDAMSRRVRSWIKDAGLTTETFAERFSAYSGEDIPVSTVRSWVHNTRSLSFDRAYQIADFFDKSLDEMAVRNWVPYNQRLVPVAYPAPTAGDAS